jgi:predicted dienelactone hydrolase
MKRFDYRRAALIVWALATLSFGVGAAAWGATESPLPALTGSDGVGRSLLYLTDESRPDADGPNGKREIAVWIWYPATPKQGAAPAKWLPGKWADAFWATFVKRFPDTVDYAREHPVQDIVTHSYPDAPMKAGSQSYPVVLFAPGFGENVLHYATLLEDVASHGYIVVGVDPTHYTGFDILSNGRVAQEDGTEVGNARRRSPIPFSTFLRLTVRSWPTKSSCSVSSRS